MSVVAVVGLGAMGGRMAARLLAAGHELVVWNRTADRAAPLVAQGARVAGSPAEAARLAEVVITMVADPAALRAVTEGPEGVAAGVGTASTVIEMSTVGPPAVERLASVLPDGVGLIDAPVLGSVAEAEAGSLTIFVGGPAEVLERHAKVLAPLGRAVHVGPLGAGAAAKLVANSTLLGVLGVLGEAVALADGLGLPRAAAYAVLAASPLAAQAERRRPVLDAEDGPTRFALALARKDLDLVTAAAEEAEVDLRVLTAARSWLVDAEAAGRGEQDYSLVLAHILAARRR